jgi:Ca2+-binding RTX toxin-like protein
MSTIKTSGNLLANLIDRRADKANNQYIEGLGGNDTLYGSDLADTLDGGAGADLMNGGAGNDLYFVNNTGDSVVEGANGGIDTINTTIAIDLSTSASRFQGIENLVVNASVGSLSSISLGGNAANNLITGHAGTDTLRGYAGDDTLQGLAGNDSLDGGDGNDQLDGGLGNDKLLGGANNDVLQGGAGNDTLDGGTGDDVYLVDSTDDVVTEAANAGNDTIRTTLATYSLSKLTAVENLVYEGTGAAVLTGNALGNTLAGTLGKVTLDGGAGDDTLIGNGGGDVLHGGLGDDRFLVNAGAGDTRIDDLGDNSLTSGDRVVMDADLRALTDLWFSRDAATNSLRITVQRTGQTVTLNDWTPGQTNAAALAAPKIDVLVYGVPLTLSTLQVQQLVSLYSQFPQPATGGTLSVSDQAYVSYSVDGIVTASRAPKTRILGTANADQLSDNAQANWVDVGTGNDSIWGSGYYGAAPAAPLNDDDVFFLGEGNDTIRVGSGHDTIYGGAGSDTFDVAFGAHQVNATIIDAAATGDKNVLRVITPVTEPASKLWFSHQPSNNDLIVRYGNAAQGDEFAGSITVQNWFAGTANQFDTIQFQGRSLSALQVNALVDLLGPYQPDAPATWPADLDARINSVWDDTYGRAVVGSFASETLSGKAGDDTLSGGGGSDTLLGGGGSDTYVFNQGSGSLTIADTAGVGEHNTLNFADASADILTMWFSRPAGSNDLVIFEDTTARSVTVKDWYAQAANQLDSIRLDDGVRAISIQADQVQQLVDTYAPYTHVPGANQPGLPADQRSAVAATVQNIWYGGHGATPTPRFSADTILNGTSASDTLRGSAGNDEILAGSGDDVIRLTTGQDLLVGGGGNDSYQLRNPAPGARTTISDVGSSGDVNALVFTDGSTPADLWFSLSGGDLRINKLADDVVITVAGWYNNPTGLVVSLGQPDGTGVVTLRPADLKRFAMLARSFDGARNLSEVPPEYQELAATARQQLWATALPAPDVNLADQTVIGTSSGENLNGGAGNDLILGLAGDDTISGNAGDDTLVGGTGNDSLWGGAGNDTYLFSRDSGVDNLPASSSLENDTVRFTDVNFDELWFSTTSQGNTLMINVVGSDATVYVSNWKNGAGPQQIQAQSANGLLTLDMVHQFKLLDAMAGFAAPASTTGISSAVHAAQSANWLPAVVTPA